MLSSSLHIGHHHGLKYILSGTFFKILPLLIAAIQLVCWRPPPFEMYWAPKIWQKFCRSEKRSAMSCKIHWMTPPIPGASRSNAWKCNHSSLRTQQKSFPYLTISYIPMLRSAIVNRAYYWSLEALEKMGPTQICFRTCLKNVWGFFPSVHLSEGNEGKFFFWRNVQSVSLLSGHFALLLWLFTHTHSSNVPG